MKGKYMLIYKYLYKKRIKVLTFNDFAKFEFSSKALIPKSEIGHPTSDLRPQNKLRCRHQKNKKVVC